MPAWPSTLPQDFVVEGFGLGAGQNLATFEPDAGPAMARERSIASPDTIRGAIELTAEEYLIWETFFRDTIKHGAVRFTWKHPITQLAATVMLDPSAGPPDLTTVTGSDLYRLSLTLLVFR